MMTNEQLDDLFTGTGYSYPKTLENFSKGLKILEGLSDKKDYRLQGEHDTIYVFAGAPNSDEQQIELDRLGFQYDEECESWRYYT